MHTINIRGIGDSLYDKIKSESQSRGLSINRFLVGTLSGLFNRKEKLEYHDMDDLFGTWTDKEYKQIGEAESDSRIIDEELWK
ncbi:MAG: hypothetical protein KAJ98_09025 [Spirochaetaceae bacterium]|nr:hypothetical protein [Spirochaetaceae bacterium]